MPLTDRVRQIIDTPEFRRLARSASWVWFRWSIRPRIHTRFEHSLGVYRLALLYLQATGPRRAVRRRPCRPEDAELFIAAALLHDLGHWPFCHPIEDIRLPGVPSHELFANSFLLEGEIADALRHDWGINPRDVVALLSEKPRDPARGILASMLSGPIDIDKMDYLARDSLHAGVPYGRHFDQQRLIGSLCLNEAGDGLAITDKGKTAAEMMVFARYVMFSEVYWHHGVRAATAMLQRAFYLLHGALDLDALFRMTERQMIAELERAAGAGPAGELLDGLFGPTRRLYKRLAQYSFFEQPRVVSSGWRGGPIPGWWPAPSSSRRWPARRSAAWWRRTKFCSTPRRSASRSGVQHRDLLSQAAPLPPAGRGLAGGAHSGPGAIRRLRQAGPRLRPPAAGPRAPEPLRPAGPDPRGDRSDTMRTCVPRVRAGCAGREGEVWEGRHIRPYDQDRWSPALAGGARAVYHSDGGKCAFGGTFLGMAVHV